MTKSQHLGTPIGQTVARRFAKYAASLRSAGIPETTRHNAKRCLLDWYAGTISGGMQPPATLIAKALCGSGQGNARLIPTGALIDARSAALINGAASHTVEVDDIFSPGLYHPGSPVISSALAMADDIGAGGSELLMAIVAGYEISNRIARTVNPAHYTYWHTTATVGHFGAAVAAGVLLRLSEEQLAHALSSVASFAAGLRQAFASDAMGKAFHVGRAAEAGVLGALAAKNGVTGVPDMFEGERGFGSAMSSAVDWGEAYADIDTTFTIDQTTQKAHACCGHTFAAIDATRALVRDHALAADDVATIRVATYKAGVEICGNGNPQTAYEAKFSLPYVVALAALGWMTGPQSFSNELLQHGGLRSMMARVIVSVDDACQSVFPNHRAAHVEIETIDGRRLAYFQRSRRGDPDEPLTDSELEEKFLHLVVPIVDDEFARALVSRIWAIDRLHNISVVNSEFAANVVSSAAE
ncbi:MAG: MmgE/PrpD family protein [Hyphomicrobiaceae bacterium]